MTQEAGILSKVHGLQLPLELIAKIAEVRGLVDLDEVQRVVIRMYDEIGADKANPDRFSLTKAPLHADASKEPGPMAGLRIIGEHRELTGAEHKAAQLRFDLEAAYAKLLSVIEDMASVQADIFATST